jgi:hypothetical protein
MAQASRQLDCHNPSRKRVNRPATGIKILLVVVTSDVVNDER